MRHTSRNDAYKEKKIKIKARPLYSLKYIQISFNNNLYNYNGLIFAELSEDIINNYMNVGIYIGLSVSNYYLNKPYRSDIEYLIVLIDIDKTVLSNDILSSVNEIGLPLIDNNKMHSIPYIKKINKKKIHTLNELKQILDNNENENIIQMNVHNSNKIKIITKNNVIEKIKMDM